jgi:DNA-binding transcriptional ArsR family regulator
MSAASLAVKRKGAAMKAAVLCKDIGAASDLLRSLANPNRLAIICLLLEGERSVMEMEAALGIRQPTLSQQLSALRDAGLIEGRRALKHVFYRVCDDRAARIVAILRTMYADLLPASAVLTRSDGTMDRAALARAAAITRIAEREMM